MWQACGDAGSVSKPAGDAEESVHALLKGNNKNWWSSIGIQRGFGMYGAACIDHSIEGSGFRISHDTEADPASQRQGWSPITNHKRHGWWDRITQTLNYKSYKTTQTYAFFSGQYVIAAGNFGSWALFIDE